MRRVLVLTALVLAVHTVGIQAQEGWLPPSRNPRFSAPARDYRSRPLIVVALPADTLVARDVAPASVAADKVPIGARTDIVTLPQLQLHAAEGAAIGFFGALIGAGIGAATYEECVPEGFLDCAFAPESPDQQAVLFGVGAALLGAGIGVPSWLAPWLAPQNQKWHASHHLTASRRRTAAPRRPGIGCEDHAVAAC